MWLLSVERASFYLSGSCNLRRLLHFWKLCVPLITTRRGSKCCPFRLRSVTFYLSGSCNLRRLLHFLKLCVPLITSRHGSKCCPFRFISITNFPPTSMPDILCLTFCVNSSFGVPYPCTVYTCSSQLQSNPVITTPLYAIPRL